LNIERIFETIDPVVTMVRNGDLGTGVSDYRDVNVSSKVAKIIQSYTSVVDRMVWRKY